MAVFSQFAEIEEALRAALNAPKEVVLQLTKTERRRIRKRELRKPIEVHAPDRVLVRFSCRPPMGTIKVRAFLYYTPFVDRAESRAYSDLQKACKAAGETFLDVVLLEKTLNPERERIQGLKAQS